MRALSLGCAVLQFLTLVILTDSYKYIPDFNIKYVEPRDLCPINKNLSKCNNQFGADLESSYKTTHQNPAWKLLNHPTCKVFSSDAHDTLWGSNGTDFYQGDAASRLTERQVVRCVVIMSNAETTEYAKLNFYNTPPGVAMSCAGYWTLSKPHVEEKDLSGLDHRELCPLNPNASKCDADLVLDAVFLFNSLGYMIQVKSKPTCQVFSPAVPNGTALYPDPGKALPDTKANGSVVRCTFDVHDNKSDVNINLHFYNKKDNLIAVISYWNY